MKIVFDHQVFSWQEYGGISRYVYELALELATTRAAAVNVVAPLYVNQYLHHAPDVLSVFGLHIKRMRRTGRIVRSINSALAWPALTYLHPDIVHETYYSPRRMSPKHTKIVLTVYDMIHEKFSDHFRPNDPLRRDKALAVDRADHIICISEQTRTDLIELLGVDRAKTSVVHLGFSFTNQGRAPAQPISRPPFLLYVGGRGGYKNFDMLLRAYAGSHRLRNDYDLVCFGGGSFSAKERALIRELGLSANRIHQTSGDDELLAAYYRSAKAFIYPSLYEGFGIPPLEAMNFDCPVVCSGVSSIPEVVGSAAEMFDPRNLESIQAAIERVVNTEALRAELISRGKERIKLFSWKRCATETLDVYRRVLS